MSSIANRFWDCVSAGSLNPPNPLLVDIKAHMDGALPSTLPRFSSIRPHHLEEAARTVQSDYETALEELVDKIQSKKTSGGEVLYEDVIPDLDRVNFPMMYVHRIAGVFSNVAKNEEMEDACNKVGEVIQFKHGSSHVLVDALQCIKEQLAGRCDSDTATPTDTEHLRAVTQFLQEMELSGQFLDGEAGQSFDDIQERLAEAERELIDLSTMELRSPMKSIALMYEILALKAERSKILGYESYADWSLAPKSLDIESVKELHNDIAAKAVPALQDALEFPTSNDAEASEDLRIYFNLDSVLDGMFNLSTALFDVIITEASADDAAKIGAWHTDVRLFHVADAASEKRIASFYLDPFRRQHKIRQEFMLPIVEKRLSDRTTPLVCLSCNIRPPAWEGDPAYLRFDDVVALFHEFGHGLQHMLPSVELGSFSGGHKIEEDMSEFLSQFMEYWLFEELFLPVIAKNARTGEPIPAEEIKKLQQSRKVRKQRELLHRLALGELEVELNSSFDPKGKESIVAVQRRIAEKGLPPFDWPPKADISLLQQVFESNALGKYTSQYRYLFSELFSADAFEAFKEAGFENEGEMKRIGKLFRTTVLEAGNDLPPKEAYRKFRGKNATSDALQKLYGLE